VTSTGHRFHPSILREYDVRGIVGETLAAADAAALGRAFTLMAARNCRRAPRICVGRDGRLSSPELEEAVVDGIRRAGGDGVRIGLGPTPMLYFAANVLDVDAAVMVTGSHNPPSHNGFKMMIGRRPFFGEMIRELGRVAAEAGTPQRRGAVETVDLQNAYVGRLLQGLAGADVSSLAVAWDPGNGAAGEIVRRLTLKLPGRHVLMNETIDGRFPAHHPDPTEPRNLVQLQGQVAEQRLDLGIAFDGDGDRIGAVDARGRIIWGDQLLAILARDVLQARPGATIIADVKASQALFDTIAALGGRPLMWKTGHSLIKTKMAETGAPLAGEMSGHIFFADGYYGYDDALFAAVRLLRSIVQAGRSLAELRDELPTLASTPEIRIDCPDERKFAIVDQLRDRLAAEGATYDDTDGIRIAKDGGWWLLRASNTQAVLVARAEARTEQELTGIMADLRSRLSDLGVAMPA